MSRRELLFLKLWAAIGGCLPRLPRLPRLPYLTSLVEFVTCGDGLLYRPFLVNIINERKKLSFFPPRRLILDHLILFYHDIVVPLIWAGYPIEDEEEEEKEDNDNVGDDGGDGEIEYRQRGGAPIDRGIDGNRCPPHWCYASQPIIRSRHGIECNGSGDKPMRVLTEDNVFANLRKMKYAVRWKLRRSCRRWEGKSNQSEWIVKGDTSL